MSAGCPRDSGFTLIEVLVAILVISTAAVAAAALFAIAAQSTRAARIQTWAALLAADKLEQLRAALWTFDPTGAALSDTTSDLSAEPVNGGGAGLTPSPSDSLERDLPGYVDYLDSSGRWLAGGSSPPARAVYVRRWNIEPLPDDPVNTLILQVLVTPVVQRQTTVVPNPAGALIVSLRTRKIRQ